jgi:heat shock protein HslJ
MNEEIILDSTSKIITSYFGNDFKYDLNKDGTEDILFILTQNNNTAIMYYVVALLKNPNGVIGSQGFFLGNRILPQSIALDKDNTIVVNYFDRKQAENFNSAPSVSKSLHLSFDVNAMQFVDITGESNGEINIDTMALNTKTWNWVKTIYSDDTEVKPKIDKKFSITFKDDKTFSATTDCNNMGGEYLLKDNQISFSKMFSTKMYCENSQEDEFTKMINETQSYLFTPKGELVLVLKFDTGSVFFN